MEPEMTLFNVFDFIVIGVVAMSAIFALFRGLIRELVSIITWILSIGVTIYAYPAALGWLAPHVAHPLAAKAAAGIGTFLAAFTGLSLFGGAIISATSGANIGMLDKSLGFAFGMIRGLLIIAIIHLAAVQVMTDTAMPDWFTQAKTRRIVEMTSGTLAALIPDYVERMKASSASLQGEVEAKREDITALRDTVIQDMSSQLADEDIVSHLTPRERDMLQKIVDALPPDRILVYTARMKNKELAQRPAYLADIVGDFRNTHTDGQLQALGLRASYLDELTGKLQRMRL